MVAKGTRPSLGQRRRPRCFPLRRWQRPPANPTSRPEFRADTNFCHPTSSGNRDRRVFGRRSSDVLCIEGGRDRHLLEQELHVGAVLLLDNDRERWNVMADLGRTALWLVGSLYSADRIRVTTSGLHRTARAPRSPVHVQRWAFVGERRVLGSDHLTDTVPRPRDRGRRSLLHRSECKSVRDSGRHVPTRVADANEQRGHSILWIEKRSTARSRDVGTYGIGRGWIDTHRDVGLRNVVASCRQSVCSERIRPGAAGERLSLVHAVRTGCRNDEGEELAL